MHAPDPGADLRQGDVCALTHVPIWNLNSVSTQSGPTGESLVLPNWTRTHQIDDLLLVIICTQCCDLENPRARTGVSIAPLMKIPAGPDEERYERILNSAEPDVLMRYEYLNLFPVQLPVEGEPALVADFSAITTMVPVKAAVPLLTDARRFTMDDDERRAFREKLGFMFGRDPAGIAEEF